MSVTIDEQPQGKGAVDLSECPTGAGNRCRCDRCRVCGYRKHMAVHGPMYGEPPGSKPWDHEFVPVKYWPS